MDKSRKNVGFIQLVLVICFINNALCHYLPQDVNTTENYQHHRFRRNIDQDQKVCDGLDIVDNVGSVVSKIPFIGPIFDTAVAVVKYGVKLTSLDNSCDSLPFEDIKKKMNERFDKLEKKVERNYVAIHQLYAEIHRLFDELTDSIKDSRIQPILSEMKTFIEGFSVYQSKIDEDFEDGYIDDIKNILDDLEDAIKPTGGLLSTPVNNIINQNFAIPEDGDDQSGLLAFNALYYGVQTYATVLSFLFEKHLLLADYYYENTDLVNFNKQLRMMKVVWRDLKSLTSRNNQQHIDNNEFYSGYGTSFTQSNTLFDRFFNTAQLAIRRINIQRRDSDKPLIDNILEKVEAMKKTNNEIIEIVSPIIKETPRFGKITIKNPEREGGRLRKFDTLYGEVERVWVKYAIQYIGHESSSEISDWTTKYTIGETKYVSIELPFVNAGTSRAIFRQISTETSPELVAIIENPNQILFNDINRDLYNVASWTNEDMDMTKAISSRLINNGADVNAIFEERWSTLHAAADTNNIQAANILLQNQNIKVNIQNQYGYTPLHIAAELGNYEFCELLISNGADVNIKMFNEGLAPLHVAVNYGQKSIVELLMKSQGININLGDTNGDTPLHYAVQYSQSIVEAMIANGEVDVNAKNNDGLTPLHYAVFNMVPNVVSALLSNNKINVNVLSNTKLSPLHHAAMDNSYDVAKLLATYNRVNVNIEGPEGLRPIHFAAMAGNADLLKLLADNNADLNAKSNTQWTALHFAVSLRETNIFYLLLSLKSRGLDVNSKTDEGYTPLHMAVASAQYYVIEALIKEGAELEAKTNDGLTALHVASMHNDIQVLRILAHNGANIYANTPQGKPSYTLAVEKGALEVVKDFSLVFSSHKEQIELLNLAAEKGKLEVIKYFIEELKWNRDYPEWKDALYISIDNNHTKTSTYLLDLFVQKFGTVKLADLGKHFVAAARAENLHIVKYIEGKQDMLHNSVRYDNYYGLLNFYDNYVDKNGIHRKRTAFHEAGYARNKPIMYHLIRVEACYECRDDQGKSLKDITADAGMMDLYGMFVVNEACAGMVRGNYDETILRYTQSIEEICYDKEENIFSRPINIAISHDRAEAKKIIPLVVNINSLDDNRNTPLHIALARKNFELVELIMKKNPDVRIQNIKNQKPVDIAREHGASDKIISKLIDMENKLNQKDGLPK